MRQRIVIDPNVIHASDKAHADVIKRLVDGRHETDFGSEKHVVGFEIEHVVDTRCRSLRSVGSVDDDLSQIAQSFQADFVPVSVVDRGAGYAHQALATSAIESVLNVTIDDLQDAVIDASGSKHDVARRMECPDPQRHVQMAIDERTERVLSVRFAGEGERMPRLVAASTRCGIGALA